MDGCALPSWVVVEDFAWAKPARIVVGKQLPPKPKASPQGAGAPTWELKTKKKKQGGNE